MVVVAQVTLKFKSERMEGDTVESQTPTKPAIVQWGTYVSVHHVHTKLVRKKQLYNKIKIN